MFKPWLQIIACIEGLLLGNSTALAVTELEIDDPDLNIYPLIPRTVLQASWKAIPGIWYQLEHAENVNGPWNSTSGWSVGYESTICGTVPANTITLPHLFLRLKMTPLQSGVRLVVSRNLSEIIEDYSTYNFGFLANIITNQVPKYRTSILETQRWSGVIYIGQSDCKYLYVQSDDGCMISINGVIRHNTLNQQQAWYDIEHSLDCLGKLPEGSNRVQVTYANLVHDNSYPYDGITLYLVGSFTCANHFIEGTNTICWYGGESSSNTYRLNYTSDSITWRTSSNLTATLTNNQLQSLTVTPLGQSAAPLSDWIEAQWNDACNDLNQTSRFYLTLLRPRDVNILSSTCGVMEYDGKIWFCLSNRLQILDQFGGTWSNDCYVSSDSAVLSPDPMPGGVQLIPDLSSVYAPLGICSELYGIRSVPGTYDILQNRANRAHLSSGFGATIDLIRVKYHAASFGENSIQINTVP